MAFDFARDRWQCSIAPVEKAEYPSFEGQRLESEDQTETSERWVALGEFPNHAPDALDPDWDLGIDAKFVGHQRGRKLEVNPNVCLQTPVASRLPAVN